MPEHYTIVNSTAARSVVYSSTYPSDSVQNPGPTDHQAYSRPSSQISIDTGCIGCRLFISEANILNTQVESFLGDFNHGDSHNAEEYIHVKIAQGTSDDLRACQRR